MIDLLAWDTGQWKEGAARLELPFVGNLYAAALLRPGCLFAPVFLFLGRFLDTVLTGYFQF